MKKILALVMIAVNLLFSQNIRDYDIGYKDVKWGTSLVEAKSLIKGTPYNVVHNLPDSYNTDWSSKTMATIGHSLNILTYYDVTNETAAKSDYSFIDEKFYKIEKYYYKGSSDIQKAYIVAMKDKMNKQYGKGTQKGTIIIWQSKVVSITFQYQIEKNTVFGDQYSDITLTVESKQYKKLYDAIQKEIYVYEKKKAGETARKILD
jgi:hypothetical protein